MQHRLFRRLSALLFLILLRFTINAQNAHPDLNAYYHFPWSVGFEYQNLTPLVSYPYGTPFALYDLSADFRWPIPGLPVLQPAIRGGWLSFSSQSQAESPLKWSHADVYGQLGLIYSNRFAKYFELGAEIFTGASESLFYGLVSDIPEPLGATNLLFELGGRIGFDPSYNVTVEIHPSLRYQLGLGALHAFDGSLFGIGFSVGYRYGSDPDAPTAGIRALRFEKASIPHAFAAMQSWYAKNPIGSITLLNTEKAPLADIDVSFQQKGYMDSPTASAKIAEMKAGESREVDLYALFNDAVFAVEGVTPLTGEVIVSYKMQGRPAEQRESLNFDLYDKRAIIWDDDRKVSALITPDDAALKNYGGFIRQACKADVVPGLNEPLQLGMQVFAALGEIGCLYQANTQLPFARVQGNPALVDTVHLARDTLKSGLGDCSDLTVLYCGMLEALAVDTGFITVPGHIFAAINTKMPSRQYAAIHPDRGMCLDVNGEIWVPMEITLIGKSGFMEAWRKGMEEWTAYDAKPDSRRFYSTKESWQRYRPVGLKETDLGLQYGRGEAIMDGFRKDRDKLIELVTGTQLSAAQQSGKKQDWNKAGITLAKFLQYGKAEQAFRKALGIDAGYADARINLGSLLYLQQKYADAFAVYDAARETLERVGQQKGNDLLLTLYLDISRTYYQMEKYAEAKDYFQKAYAIDAGKAEAFDYLQHEKTAGSRGAGQEDPLLSIQFAGERGNANDSE